MFCNDKETSVEGLYCAGGGGTIIIIIIIINIIIICCYMPLLHQQHVNQDMVVIVLATKLVRKRDNYSVNITVQFKAKDSSKKDGGKDMRKMKIASS